MTENRVVPGEGAPRMQIPQVAAALIAALTAAWLAVLISIPMPVPLARTSLASAGPRPGVSAAEDEEVAGALLELALELVQIMPNLAVITAPAMSDSMAGEVKCCPAVEWGEACRGLAGS